MTTENQNRRYTLDGGPGKFDLMAALFDNMPSHPRYAIFTIADCVEIRGEGNTVVGHLPTQPCHVVINSVSREDGSGESWIFNGYTTDGGCFRKGAEVKGYFSTKTRRGWIEFLPR